MQAHTNEEWACIYTLELEARPFATLLHKPKLIPVLFIYQWKLGGDWNVLKFYYLVLFTALLSLLNKGWNSCAHFLWLLSLLLLAIIEICYCKFVLNICEVRVYESGKYYGNEKYYRRTKGPLHFNTYYQADQHYACLLEQ